MEKSELVCKLSIEMYGIDAQGGLEKKITSYGKKFRPKLKTSKKPTYDSIKAERP